jgi:diaminohydroxyphosphoribosylaminopyrimidine deaminase/5-amino-6-(5-phosphoribosylamino)uracil reductase
MNPTDESWMRRALELAERGRGHVEPNPLVGAVLVRDGAIVGEGWHQKFGEPHAEINALAQAGESARGATLYVTLEPCCHHGKTPPCTEALIRAGVARVYTPTLDPFREVAGRGAVQLQDAGIPVEFGLCAAAARVQNAPYYKLLRTGRPYVHAKWAMSLDGKIATRTGASKWISNEASRRRVHELRGRMDAIVVGIDTVIADDPLLTARPPGPRVATRVVLDSLARISKDSQLMQTARDIPTLLVMVNNQPIPPSRLFELDCELLPLDPGPNDKPDLEKMLDAFGTRRWTNILVEGGATLLGSFFDAKLIDEAHVFVAPKLIGGTAAKSPIAGVGIEQIDAGGAWVTQSVETLDGDAYLRCLRTQSA